MNLPNPENQRFFQVNPIPVETPEAIFVQSGVRRPNAIADAEDARGLRLKE